MEGFRRLEGPEETAGDLDDAEGFGGCLGVQEFRVEVFNGLGFRV